MRVPLWGAVLALLALQSAAILFDLSPASPNLCIGDEFYEGHVITVKYNVPDDADAWDTSLTLHGPMRGNKVLHAVPNVDNNPGEFSYEVHDDGYYRVCLTAQSVGQAGANFRGRNRRQKQGDILRGQQLGLNTRRVELKLSEASVDEDDYYKQQREYEKQANDAAKNAKDANTPGKEDLLSPHDLQPVNILLIRTESQLEKLKGEFREFRARESEHRNTNESTNRRTVSFSLLTIIALVILALWQGFYMRNYFKKKKLI